MDKTNIGVEFDSIKLKALRYYLSKNQMTVEDELQKHMEKLYDKNVPLNVKEYVQFQTDDDTPKSEQSEQTNEASVNDEVQDKQTKSNRRQKDKDQESQKEDTVTEKVQTMTMSF